MIYDEPYTQRIIDLQAENSALREENKRVRNEGVTALEEALVSDFDLQSGFLDIREWIRATAQKLEGEDADNICPHMECLGKQKEAQDDA